MTSSPALVVLGLLLAACAGRAPARPGTPDGVRWCSVEDESAGRCVARLLPEPVFAAPTVEPSAGSP